MPIRINLLAEAIAEEELRRRDPVKRAIYGGAFLVALSLVWFSSTWLEFMVDKQNLNRLEADIQEQTNNYALVQSNKKKIDEVQKRMNALDELQATRFLQGNLMNALQQMYVSNVALSRLHVDQSYTATPAIAPVTNNFGVVAGRPPQVTEHIALTLDARDSSPNPGGDQMNHFKDGITNQPYFKPLINPVNGVRLAGISPLQTPAESKPFVMFTLECHFTDKKP
jgi:hypothetical protein